MKVIDLIIKLQQLPLDMKVMIDASNENTDMWKFKALAEADEVETPTGDKFVALFSESSITDEQEEN